MALAEAIEHPAAVVGADLNCWSAGFLESAVPLLRTRFPHSPLVTAPTFRVGGVVPLKLDHLLFRLPESWRAEIERVGDLYGSDHHPLIGVVRLGS